MPTIIVHQMSKEEVYQLLNSRYSFFLHEVAEYLRLTAKEKDRNKPDCVYEDAARELIYRECLKIFRYSGSVNDVKDALDSVYHGSYSKQIQQRVKEERAKKAGAEEQKKRQEKIEKLKEECQKNGLDFRKEKKKLLKELKKQWKKEKSDPVLTTFKLLLLISSAVCAISLIIMFVGLNIEAFAPVAEAFQSVASISFLLTIALGYFLYKLTEP